MIIQNRDGSIAQQPGQGRLNTHKRHAYYAAVPTHLLDEQNTVIDRIIGFAFETLGARRLEVRVYDEPDEGLLSRTGTAHVLPCQPLCAG